MELTGCPSPEHFSRCSTALYNDMGSMASQMYDIIRNHSYNIEKEFSQPDIYIFCQERSIYREPWSPAQEERKDCTTGSKAAQKGNKGSDLKDSTATMDLSLDKVEKTPSEAKRAKHASGLRSIQLQENMLE